MVYCYGIMTRILPFYVKMIQTKVHMIELFSLQFYFVHIL